MKRPDQPTATLKFGEYWVWNNKLNRYELWGSTRAFDGEKIIELEGVE